MRRSLVLLILAALFALAFIAPASAQTVAPEQPCLPGQLCGGSEAPSFGGGPSGPISDPGGNYLRTFLVMALIGLVVAMYLAVALGGKRLPFRRRTARA